jgi:cytidylate kinase
MSITVITMTREIGSRGTDVAAGLAARLGLKIIRAETVAERVAERLGVEAGAVLRYAEGSASLLERWRIDRKRLFHYAAEEVLRLAQEGNVLVKGWGAATLLRDMPQVLNVRVCAPMESRVGILMERRCTKDAYAVRAYIERQDAARARTMRAFFGTEQEDASLYHVVLNTDLLSIDDCVNTVSDFAQTPRFQNTAAIRSALANKLAEAKIGTAFAEQINSSMAPLGVRVSVADGRVTIAGTSSSGSLRQKAEQIAHRVAGAYQIDNRIISVPSHGRF